MALNLIIFFYYKISNLNICYFIIKMTSIEKIKRIFDNFLETRAYNYYKAEKK